MTKKTLCLLGILLTIIVGTVLYYFLCCKVCYSKEQEKTEPNKEVVNLKAKEVSKNAFLITDAASNLKIESQDNFNFKMSNFSILEPLSLKVKEESLKLKNYLLSNPSKTIDILGFYKSDEVNNSAFPNLGLARANAVKNYFVTLGIASKQINTNGKLNDTINPDKESTLFGPFSFGVLTGNDTDTSEDDALKTACESIKENPLVLYFKTGQTAINLTTEQRNKIATISKCVDKTGVKVQVIGHTDNVGNANNNVVLGQKRADFARNYLIKNGILGNNIEALSKGDKEPIANNATQEGRTKNRRTVITIN